MSKIMTTIEQSKKLVELGIDLNTADMYYWHGSHRLFRVNDGKREDIDVPAWSLSALLKFLPSEFTTVGKKSSTTYKLAIRKYKADDGVDLYQIAYGNYVWHEDEGHTWHDMINTGQKEDFVDVAFDMIVWLKENKFL